MDARYVLETDDLARIEVKDRGIRHGARDLMDRISAGDFVSPEHYYFRTAPQFDVPAGKYDWLRRSIFIGIGERYLNFVAVRVWRVR